MELEKIKGILFDLDGTLLNSLPDIGFSANLALEEFGYDTHEIEDYKMLLGNGSRYLITNAMPEKNRTKEHIEEVLSFYLDKYKNLTKERSLPYDGVLELLEKLSSMGIKLAVVTNKNDFLAQKIVKKFFPETMFDFIIGQKDGFPSKPDPYMGLKAMEVLCIEKENTLFVGDTSVDIKTAENLGVKSIGVSWGFRPGSELEDAGAWKIADHPLDILDV